MMQIRNPAFNATGGIDCEVEHPEFGWIPYTARADDPAPSGWVIHAAALAMDPAPYVAPPPPPPTGADVNAERDARVRAGRVVEIAGHGPVRLGGSEADIRNLQGLAVAAQLRLAAGDGAAITLFRDEDNVIHALDQAQTLALWSAGAAYVSAVFQAGWALKDNPAGIPADFRDGSHWP
ncbi:DUF4376 domain-containing protein [Defluviimonas sp. D31]|uniref:DUF4376 domain-containing protein n=1 Tax=Defluviimonas sp. D31 TaxID=3083253 RepID=UPI00296EDF71|nr:DUF4376 domain-containing protein [Defluviimonas sp. D31]MDW4550890.1 DUF4376 domain-containing protein [Defluviimonas sp. D31]